MPAEERAHLLSFLCDAALNSLPVTMLPPPLSPPRHAAPHPLRAICVACPFYRRPDISSLNPANLSRLRTGAPRTRCPHGPPLLITLGLGGSGIGGHCAAQGYAYATKGRIHRKGPVRLLVLLSSLPTPLGMRVVRCALSAPPVLPFACQGGMAEISSLDDPDA